MKSIANRTRTLVVLGIIISLFIGVDAALGCDSPPPVEAKIWSSSASTSLTIELGDPIDAIAPEKLNHIALKRENSSEVTAQTVVVVPSGYWVDTSSTLTLVKDDTKSVSLYYRLAPVPKGEPILGCDTKARLTFKLTGLSSMLSDSEELSVTIRRLDLESALPEIETATK